MRVLPVLDVMGGCAVHARAGNRSEYQPLQSIWADHASDPLALTSALRNRFGITEWYLADLDALEGQRPQRDLVDRLIASGLRLWLDAGTRTTEEATMWLAVGVHRLILASETLPSCHLLAEAVRVLGPERVVFSLDLQDAQVRAIPGVFSEESPRAVAGAAVDAGITQLIVLDTASVGTSRGPSTIPLCLELRRRHPIVKLITGGGIRDRDDLAALQAAGVDIALVGTALHVNRDFAESVHGRGDGVEGNR